MSDCQFVNNSVIGAGGGGTFAGDATILRCAFTGNSAQFGGGAVVQSDTETVVFVSCNFEGNTANDLDGGAIAVTTGGDATLTNCLIEGNTALFGMGAVSVQGNTSEIALINCTIAENSGGGIRNDVITPGTASVMNSIIWGNANGDALIGDPTTVMFSNIEGGAPGAGNIDTDPVFVNELLGNFRLNHFGSPCIDTGSNGLLPLDVADLDGDGALDVVTANRGSRTVSLLRGVGDGTLLPHRQFAAGSGPFHVVAADLNGDGALDLAVADFDGNALAVLQGDGRGGCGAPALYGAGISPAWTVAGDFNADGHPDLAVANFQSGNVMVFTGDGSGAMTSALALAAAAGPRAVAVSDLDDDGRLDLLAVARDDDLVTWYLNEGPFPAEDDSGEPPTAVAGADQTRECASRAGAMVRLDGSASFSAEGEIVRFEWLLANGELLAEGAVVNVELPLGLRDLPELCPRERSRQSKPNLIKWKPFRITNRLEAFLMGLCW